MMKNLLISMKIQYKDFEINDNVFNDLYHDAINSIDKNSNVNSEYLYYDEFRKKIDNYIMKEIQNGNEMYQLILSDMKVSVIQRYFNLKSKYLDVETINTKYQKLEQTKRLIMYYTDLSEMVTEKLKEDYDYNSPLDKQYIKELNKKFNK